MNRKPRYISLLLLALLSGCTRGADTPEAPRADRPQVIPAAVLIDLQGRQAPLRRYDGRVLLLDLWATWCGPCVEALPRMQALHEQYRGKDLVVVGVSLDEGGAAVVRPFVRKRGVTYPMLLDSWGETSLAKGLGVTSLPALFLVDRSGQIVGRWTGEADRDEIEAAVVNALQ